MLVVRGACVFLMFWLDGFFAFCSLSCVLFHCMLDGVGLVMLSGVCLCGFVLFACFFVSVLTLGINNVLFLQRRWFYFGLNDVGSLLGR